MTAAPNPVGQIAWHDLTVPDAPRLRDFYKAVVGWSSSDVAMRDPNGAYADFCMHAPASSKDDTPVVAGVCHTRGGNSRIPAQWLIYITVADVEASARKSVELGGRLLDGPRKAGNHIFCCIQDPAGAVCALISP